MTDDQRRAQEIMAQMLPPEVTGTMAGTGEPSLGFAEEIGQIGRNFVYESLWTRQQIDLRTRSIITVAMLIAQRSVHELAIHVPAAIRNGVTIDEIAEIIYHATAYCGFPAATSAREVAERALRNAGMVG